MMKEQPESRNRQASIACGDPFHRLLDEAYRIFDHPAPRHLPGCGCALCADPGRACALTGRAARDWTAEDVSYWFARAGGGERGRTGVEVASRTDRAVFRFLLPRILELLAAGQSLRDGAYGRALVEFAPAHGGAWNAGQRAVLDRFSGLMIDRSIHDAGWPHDLLETMQLLACGGWPVHALLRQALGDPDLPAALARIWGRAGHRDTLFPGHWPVGAVDALRRCFVTPLMAERMMNYAMAEGAAPEETDAAMRTADLLLRSR